MLMVVMMHLGLARTDENFNPPDMPIGPFTGIAIPMFFMVSGYLLSIKTPSWSYSFRKVWGIIKYCLLICIPMSIVMSFTSGELQLLFPECLIQKGRIFQFWYFGSMMIIYLLLPYLIICIKHKYFRFIMMGVFALCSFIFILNYFCGFEKNIIQTFRLWNWFFYFFLGAFIRLNDNKFKWIRWYYIIPSLAVYIIFFDLMKVGANEYYFCSPLCTVHTTIVFVTILNSHISGNKVLSQLANCFLPVYTFHTFIEVFFCSKTPLFKWLEQTLHTRIAYTSEYMIVAVVCVVISLAVMRTPYMDRVFKI